MKRRGFVKALAAIPAAPALLTKNAAAQRPAAATAAPVAGELPVLAISAPDLVADPVPHYFTPAQFAALRKVSDILMPSLNGAVGALDAKAPEFLDFLIGESPADRQHVYQTGLDALNAQAQQRYNKPFGELDAAQADVFFAALKQPWTFESPADPVAAFLRVAKQDVRTATLNSREYGTPRAGAPRRFNGGGIYWSALD